MLTHADCGHVLSRSGPAPPLRRWTGLPADDPGPHARPAAGGAVRSAESTSPGFGRCRCAREAGPLREAGLGWAGGRERLPRPLLGPLLGGDKCQSLAGARGLQAQGQKRGFSWKNLRNRVGGAGREDPRRGAWEVAGVGWPAPLEGRLSGSEGGEGEAPWARRPVPLLDGE